MNKYAEGYFDSLLNEVKKYRPFNTNDASTGLALGALGGGALGGLHGLVTDPGYDSEGMKKSRLKESIKQMFLGGTIGGLGAMALPSIAQGGVNISQRLMEKTQPNGVPDLRNAYFHKTLSDMLQGSSIPQLGDTISKIPAVYNYIQSVGDQH